jgi:hypothetical protein
VVGQVHSWKLRGVVISHSFAFSASRRLKFSYKSIFPCTIWVFGRDSPGKAAQWLTRSIRESWGVLWLVIRLLSGRADVSSLVIKALRTPVLHSPPHWSACWCSPYHYPYFSYAASEDFPWKLRGVMISHSFAFRASRRLKSSYKSIFPCTAFPSTLVSMLELSPPLRVLLLLRVGALSRLNTRALHHNGLPQVQLMYLEVTVEEKLSSGWPGPFVKVEGCCD